MAINEGPTVKNDGRKDEKAKRQPQRRKGEKAKTTLNDGGGKRQSRR
jgi:hypothetical protein